MLKIKTIWFSQAPILMYYSSCSLGDKLTEGGVKIEA